MVETIYILRSSMERYVIKGGRPLKGVVPIYGAKNAALAVS